MVADVRPGGFTLALKARRHASGRGARITAGSSATTRASCVPAPVPGLFNIRRDRGRRRAQPRARGRRHGVGLGQRTTAASSATAPTRSARRPGRVTSLPRRRRHRRGLRAQPRRDRAGHRLRVGQQLFGRNRATPRAPIPRLPAIMPGLSGVVALAADTSHSLALQNDGTVRAWGDGYSGQLGDGQRTPSVDAGSRRRASPRVTAIAAGGMFSMARTGDGSRLGLGRQRQRRDRPTARRIERDLAVADRRRFPPSARSPPAARTRSRSRATAASSPGARTISASWATACAPALDAGAVVPGATSIAKIAAAAAHARAARGRDGARLGQQRDRGSSATARR